MPRSAPIAGTATLMAVTYAIDEPRTVAASVSRRQASSLSASPRVRARSGFKLPHGKRRWRRRTGARAPTRACEREIDGATAGAGRSEHDVRTGEPLQKAKAVALGFDRLPRLGLSRRRSRVPSPVAPVYQSACKQELCVDR